MLEKLNRLLNFCKEYNLTIAQDLIESILKTLETVTDEKLITALCQSILNKKLAELMVNSDKLTSKEKGILELEIKFLQDSILK
jgi:hypothetical protein